jgi:hypothetical protein
LSIAAQPARLARANQARPPCPTAGSG